MDFPQFAHCANAEINYVRPVIVRAIRELNAIKEASR